MLSHWAEGGGARLPAGAELQARARTFRGGGRDHAHGGREHAQHLGWLRVGWHVREGGGRESACADAGWRWVN